MLKKKRVVFFAVLFLAVLFLGFTGFLLRHRVPPILMYHSVNPQVNPIMKALIVSPAAFEKQLSFLKRNNYNVLPLEKMIDLISEGKLPPKAIALTFDDGYRDFYTYAFPVLRKYGMPATMFIIVNEVGRKEGDRLSWEEIKEMQGSGLITFGSHSMDAEPLINIESEERIKRNIFQSKRDLEDKLGCAVTMFSYPEGFLNKRIRDLVIEAGYKLAVSTKTGRCYPARDRFALKRIRISESAKNPLNLWIKASGYHTFFKDRKCR